MKVNAVLALDSADQRVSSFALEHSAQQWDGAGGDTRVFLRQRGVVLRHAESASGGQPVGRPPLLNCPSWARTRTLLIPCHFGFRRRSTSVRGLDCAFTFALTRSGGSRPVSTPSPLGAWLGVASQGFADFESIHARRFRRGVQRAHRQVPLESGVLPVTPRGSVPVSGL